MLCICILLHLSATGQLYFEDSESPSNRGFDFGESLEAEEEIKFANVFFLRQRRAYNERHKWLHNSKFSGILLWVRKHYPENVSMRHEMINNWKPTYLQKKSPQFLDDIMAKKVGWRKSGSVTSMIGN